MNTASQDLNHHLGVLRDKMLHPSDYELAVNYFLEEFAGDVNFMSQSEADDAPHLLGLLQHVVSKTMGKPVQFDESRAFLLKEHHFYHGNAILAERVLLFFYFRKVDCGVMALMPGVTGAMDVARFRLPAGLADPRKN